MSKPPKIRERKLGRDQAVGLCWTDGVIEIDPRLGARDYLGTLIHELLHHVLPGAQHGWIEKTEKIMANAIWQRGYRRIQK